MNNWRVLDKEFIIEKLLETKREGIENLIAYLNESDFFAAPASTKYHSSFEGGLAAHSIRVYELLVNKNLEFGLNLPDESVVITALLHDLCKVNFYTKDKKSVLKGKKFIEKNKQLDDGTWAKVQEEVNNWEEEEIYVVKDTFPIGHGEKSVIQIMKYINLTDTEIAMIRWHMGFTEPKELHRNLNNAIDLYPSIIALFTSDLEASYYKEDRFTE